MYRVEEIYVTHLHHPVICSTTSIEHDKVSWHAEYSLASTKARGNGMVYANHVANLDISATAIQLRDVNPIAMHVESGKHRRPFGLNHKANVLCEEVSCCEQLDDINEKRDWDEFINDAV